MKKSKATDLRSLTHSAFSGLSPDLGECDLDDAVIPVMDEIYYRIKDDSDLKALARSVFNYEYKTMQEIKTFLKEIVG